MDKEKQLLIKKSQDDNNDIIVSFLPLLNSEEEHQKLTEIYNTVKDLIKYNSTYSYTSDSTKNSVSQIINTLENEQKHGINEDKLGALSYQNHSIYAPDNITVTLAFSCFKKYHQNKKNEPIPSFLTKQGKLLAKALGIKVYDESDNDYPAYNKLLNSLVTISKSQYEKPIKELTNYFYSGKPITFPPYTSIIDDLKNQFYKTAWDEFYSTSQKINPLVIGDLIHLIEFAKLNQTIKDEKDLGSIMLTFNPTKYISDAFRYSHRNYSKGVIQNRISLLCGLITKYNCQRKNKKTPHWQQLKCYNLIKKANLAFPDSFTSDVFNENTYAFTEFSDLIKAIKNLKTVKENEIEKFIKECYPSTQTVS